MYYIQHICFICRPSDSTVSEDAGMEPKNVATLALAVRRSKHSARFHPQLARYHPQLARYHPQLARYHPQLARSHPQLVRYHPQLARSLTQLSSVLSNETKYKCRLKLHVKYAAIYCRKLRHGWNSRKNPRESFVKNPYSLHFEKTQLIGVKKFYTCWPEICSCEKPAMHWPWLAQPRAVHDCRNTDSKLKLYFFTASTLPRW